MLKSRNLDKFESRSTDGIFLGYPAHTRGYQVLVLETNKMLKSVRLLLMRLVLELDQVMQVQIHIFRGSSRAFLWMMMRSMRMRF